MDGFLGVVSDRIHDIVGGVDVSLTGMFFDEFFSMFFLGFAD